MRFAISEYPEDMQQNIVRILQPFTGEFAVKKAEEYQAYLKQYEVDIPQEDAWYFALEACRENQKLSRKRAADRRNQWLYDNFPFYREIVDFTGSNDFVIKPSAKFIGEAFSGKFISPAFVKHSEKRQQRKNESDRQYKKYLDKRDSNLANADGVNSDEIAEAIARKWGRDPLVLLPFYSFYS